MAHPMMGSNRAPVTPEEKIEAQLAAIVLDSEVATSAQNLDRSNRDFEDMVDMLECRRAQKEYEWMTDIFIPEYPSQVMTIGAMDAAEMFANRDFVTAYLQDQSDEANKKCTASKRLINRTLNRPSLHYFQKFMRARTMNDMASRIYARFWWNREDQTVLKGHEMRAVPMEEDIYGNPVTPETEYLRNFKMAMVPVYGTAPKIDQFDFDVLDGRNVFTPPGYWYSVQDMPWITVRFEKTLSQLRMDEKRMGYINLDRLVDVKPAEQTETAKKSHNDTGEFQMPPKTPETPYDIYERHGWMWCKVTKRNEWREPTEATPGIDESGKPMEDAEWLKVTLDFASNSARRVMIRFQPIPYRDTQGNQYYPIERGICYIHPTKDGGLGDAQMSKELQIALNDTYCLGMDREKLSQMPTLKTVRGNEENPTIYFAPGHAMELESTKDVEEVKIESKFDSTMAGVGFLSTMMHRTKAAGPSQYGDVPVKATTSATAVAGAEQHANARQSYRSLTFEYTFLQGFYRAIMLMTWQFAHYDTAKKLMGDLLADFDPGAEYLWKPVSQAIETEYSKNVKIGYFKDIFQTAAVIPNKGTAKVLNMCLQSMAELMGDEYAGKVKTALFDESDPATWTQGRSPGPAGNATAGGAATNQSGVAIQPAEAGARMAVQ